MQHRANYAGFRLSSRRPILRDAGIKVSTIRFRQVPYRSVIASYRSLRGGRPGSTKSNSQQTDSRSMIHDTTTLGSRLQRPHARTTKLFGVQSFPVTAGLSAPVTRPNKRPAGYDSGPAPAWQHPPRPIRVPVMVPSLHTLQCRVDCGGTDAGTPGRGLLTPCVQICFLQREVAPFSRCDSCPVWPFLQLSLPDRWVDGFSPASSGLDVSTT